MIRVSSMLLAGIMIMALPGMALADRYSECNQPGADWELGIRGCTKIIERGQKEGVSNLVKAFLSRAIWHSNMRQYDLSIADCTKAIQLNPGSGRAYRRRGQGYRNKRDWKRALSDYTKAIELEPTPLLYHGRSKIYEELGKFNLAIADLSMRIKIYKKTKYIDFYYRDRGLLYEKLKMHEKAIQDFTKIIELEPDNHRRYHDRGMLYERLGMHDAAIADFSKRIELIPKIPWVYTDRGRLFERLKRYDKAIADFSRPIELQPEEDKHYRERGSFYSRMTRHSDAIKDFTEAIELKPEYSLNWKLRGDANHGARKHSHAIADYSKAISLIGEDKDLASGHYFARGLLFREMGELVAAIGDFSEAIKIGACEYDDFDDDECYKILSVDAVYHIERAKTYLATDQNDRANADYAEAARLLTKVIESRPFELWGSYKTGGRSKTAALYALRAMSHLGLGQLPDGMSDANQALKLNPNDARALAARGQLYAAMGKADLAIADVQRALQIQPDDKDIEAAVARLEAKTLPGRSKANEQVAKPNEMNAKEAWAAIKDTKSVAILEAFIRQYPETVLANFARARADELRAEDRSGR